MCVAACVFKRYRLFNVNARPCCMRMFANTLDTEDVGFPYMMDARRSPDTLFLLADSDFRFFECDCFGDECLLIGSHRTAQRPDAAGEPQAAAGASRPAVPMEPIAHCVHGARATSSHTHALQVLTHRAF